MTGPSKKRLQEGALSALKTPVNLPSIPRLVPVEGARQAKELASDESEDLRLVQQAVSNAKAGDQGGIDYLYIRYASDVQRFIESLVREEDLSEEITNHIFDRLITTIGKYEPREVPFAAWIMRLARNAALDSMRARRAIPAEEVRLADSGRATPETSADRKQDLRSALEQLPEDQREVLILRHIAGLSPVEIAATLEKSESSVHALHHRGRRTLQARLTELNAHQHALQELVGE
jgi:RNA polymerase sigma-70 factor (ECF subfamily)